MGSFMDITGDLTGGGRLLIDSGGDGGSDPVDADDGLADVADGIDSTTVAVWIVLIWPAISSVARAVWLASSLTSLATMAKPLPASPARAASIVAFSARRLICPAMF